MESFDNAAEKPQPQHHRMRDYKAKRGLNDQNKRRALFLSRQKEARRDAQAEARAIASRAGNADPDQAEADSVVDVSAGKGGQRQQHKQWKGGHSHSHTHGHSYRGANSNANLLMRPEELVNVPSDLCGGWLVVPIPIGQRCIVVSYGGTTISRYRSGKLFERFVSMLPSGNYQLTGQACSEGGGSNQKEYCILDCIFHQPDSTYYVLDMMCWKGYSVLDCSTEFRFYWLHTKLGEVPSLQTADAKNPHRIVPLNRFECDIPGLTAAANTNFGYIKDSLWLYNKEAVYLAGSDKTPLVNWVELGHVEGNLGVSVPPEMVEMAQNAHEKLQQVLAARGRGRGKGKEEEEEMADDGDGDAEAEAMAD